MSQHLELMRRSELFEGIEEDALTKFAETGSERTYEAGDVIFVEQSIRDEFYLIVDGRVSIEFALANEDLGLESVILEPGQIIGEIAFIEQGEGSATATAASDLRVLVWKFDDIRAICDADPATGYRFVTAVARVLCERLRKANLRMLNSVSWAFE